MITDNAELPKSGSAKFRPRARLISLIGDELISDEAVAVVELVKNSYDADASRVTVTFHGDASSSPSSLSVVDNGVGMSLDTVLNAWFEPGTISKTRGEKSPGGRVFLGAKGIGRFAAARLGDSLLMQTRREGEGDGVTVLLEWGRFDDNSYLDDITIEYEVAPLKDLARGTKLEIGNLQIKKMWGDEDFASLHNRLSRMVSPFKSSLGHAEVADFEVVLFVPGHPELTGTVEPHEITGQPKYKLTGRLDDNGVFNGHIEHDGTRVKSIENRALGAANEKVKCGAFEVEIRAWDRDRLGLSSYIQKYQQSISRIRELLDEYCGVSIYRDGFRVYPYGEKGIDWLSLDTRSRQNPTMNIANNQVIAAIRLSRDTNPKLVDRSNREGLVLNGEYDALKDWFIRILKLLEAERYGLRPRAEKPAAEVSTLFEPFDMTEVISATDKQLGAKHPVSKLVRQKDSDIRDGLTRLQEHYSRLLLAAGLGQLIDLVVHEIGAPLGRLAREIEHLQKQITGVFGDPAIERIWGPGAKSKLLETFERLKSWLEQIATLRERLVPKAAGKRGRATIFDVNEEIQDNINLFSHLISKQKIDCKVMGTAQPLEVHMSRSNLGQIIANLLDNSVYWLTKHHGPGGGGRIEILLRAIPNGFRLRICDDGPGIDDEDREQIFDPGFSRKTHGMGLGLFIARSVIEGYGKLTYREDCDLPGACFQADFEQRVGR